MRSFLLLGSTPRAIMPLLSRGVVGWRAPVYAGVRRAGKENQKSLGIYFSRRGSQRTKSGPKLGKQKGPFSRTGPKIEALERASARKLGVVSRHSGGDGVRTY